jgi:hypothetical protein
MGCGTSTIKYLLFIFNLIFAVSEAFANCVPSDGRIMRVCVFVARRLGHLGDRSDNSMEYWNI